MALPMLIPVSCRMRARKSRKQRSGRHCSRIVARLPASAWLPGFVTAVVLARLSVQSHTTPIGNNAPPNGAQVNARQLVVSPLLSKLGPLSNHAATVALHCQHQRFLVYRYSSHSIHARNTVIILRFLRQPSHLKSPNFSRFVSLIEATHCCI